MAQKLGTVEVSFEPLKVRKSVTWDLLKLQSSAATLFFSIYAKQLCLHKLSASLHLVARMTITYPTMVTCNVNVP